jgi:hypothetical protein
MFKMQKGIDYFYGIISVFFVFKQRLRQKEGQIFTQPKKERSGKKYVTGNQNISTDTERTEGCLLQSEFANDDR